MIGGSLFFLSQIGCSLIALNRRHDLDVEILKEGCSDDKNNKVIS